MCVCVCVCVCVCFFQNIFQEILFLMILKFSTKFGNDKLYNFTERISLSDKKSFTDFFVPMN